MKGTCTRGFTSNAPNAPMNAVRRTSVPPRHRRTSSIPHIGRRSVTLLIGFAVACSDGGSPTETVPETITQLSQRSTYSFFREATDRTVALGPDLSTPTVSIVAAAPYTRPRIQLARQAEYGQMISFQLQSGLSGAIFLSATAGYFGGNPATWDITVPDLTPAGFQPGWAPQPGGFGTFWFISGFGWQASGLPARPDGRADADDRVSRGGNSVGCRRWSSVIGHRSSGYRLGTLWTR
jgi:hypothetical protein